MEKVPNTRRPGTCSAAARGPTAPAAVITRQRAATSSFDAASRAALDEAEHVADGAAGRLSGTHTM